MKEQLLFNSLEIRNYRAFDHLVVKNLGHVNLFIGKNNIGKSSLLEALWLYANLGAPKIIEKILIDRDDLSIRSATAESSVTVSQGVCNLFFGNPTIERINQSIEIGRINAPDSSLKISVNWFVESRSLGSRLIPAAMDSSGSFTDKIPGLVIRIGTIHEILGLDEPLHVHSKKWFHDSAEIIPSPFIGPNGIRKSDFRAFWNRVVLSELKTDVIESLRIINPGIDDVAVINTGNLYGVSVNIKMKGENTSVPLKSLGDGMNRLFGLALALVNAQGGILLVDEIENGLHYSVLPIVWKFILKVSQRLNVQVFATTHSMDCIKAFHAATKADESIDGVTTRIEFKNNEFRTSQFDETRMSTIIEEDIEIR